MIVRNLNADVKYRFDNYRILSICILFKMKQNTEEHWKHFHGIRTFIQPVPLLWN
jgi:hypothetical protein